MLRLTQLVQTGGCAAKLPAFQLKEILKNIRLDKPKELIIGAETMDDACVWDLGNNKVMVQTLDFFTPIVDDVSDFAQIAASNALSDIYAMGAEPSLALTIFCFPGKKLELEIAQTLLQASFEKVKESGAVIGGGHSIDDDILKLGFVVTGFAQKNEIWSNSNAKVGDKLILTKAIGTGTVTTALKRDQSKPEWVFEATESMKQLNKIKDLINDIKIHSATDITGFGLCGHSMQMANASNKTFKIYFEKIPVLSGATDCLKMEIINKAHKTNQEYVTNHVDWGELSQQEKWLICDPQTSGGLLLSVASQDAELLVKLLSKRFFKTKIIGEVIEKQKPSLIII